MPRRHPQPRKQNPHQLSRRHHIDRQRLQPHPTRRPSHIPHRSTVNEAIHPLNPPTTCDNASGRLRSATSTSTPVRLSAPTPEPRTHAQGVHQQPPTQYRQRPQSPTPDAQRPRLDPAQPNCAMPHDACERPQRSGHRCHYDCSSARSARSQRTRHRCRCDCSCAMCRAACQVSSLRPRPSIRQLSRSTLRISSAVSLVLSAAARRCSKIRLPRTVSMGFSM